jgi:ectoine hydroxylase-related dioxygenase (phytanoyl-CoA dioxygenase family)
MNYKGYNIIKDAFPTKVLDLFPRDFEAFASKRPESDVFRTKNGDVKQIQNLQDIELFQFIKKYIELVYTDEGCEVLNMQYFIKHPDYKITAPHQDGAYFDNLDDDIYTFWIPLQPVNIENSTMFYVDWNGKREIVPHESIGTNVRTRTGKTGYSQYTSVYPLESFTPVQLEYGDCVVHNQFSTHYSNENKTDKPRIALTCIIKISK